MHETVMAVHFPPEPPRAERGILRGTQRWEHGFRRAGRFAGVDEDQAARFAAGISSHAVRQFAFAQIGHVRAGAGAVVGPPVIATADRITVYHAIMQRHLPMRTPVLQRKHRAFARPHHHDRLPGEHGAQGFPGRDVA